METEYKNLRWNVFHNFEPGEMLNNIRTYVFPFIKTIGEGKDTVFLIPTAKVLAKVVDAIGAMNMMLHGVEDLHITYQNSLSGENTERDQHSLIMANHPFTGSVFQEKISS